MGKKRIGVIGGSGLYAMEGVQIKQEVQIYTPFGAPSDVYFLGESGNTEIVFLPRHGRGHRLLPSEINYRANIFGMKQLGVNWIMAVSAVGSMKEDIPPGQIVIPSQFVDRTKSRPSSFFGDGVVAHVAFADPVCPTLSAIAAKAGQEAGANIRQGGTYICIEGPHFSTRAESNIYRQWGVDVIGMTNVTEAKLAREAEICYVTLALVTDYDCWHETEEDVTIEGVLKIMAENVATAQEIIKRSLELLPEERECSCATALKSAILTDRNLIPPEAKRRLSVIAGKYL